MGMKSSDIECQHIKADFLRSGKCSCQSSLKGYILSYQIYFLFFSVMIKLSW